jgi:hypothetical protein
MLLTTSRFSSHKELYADMSCFDPSEFHGLTTGTIPENVLQRVCKFISNNDDNKILIMKLRGQLVDFAKKWPRLKMSLTQTYTEMLMSPLSTEVSEPEYAEDLEDPVDTEKVLEKNCNNNKPCQNCIVCCYQVIHNYNLYSKTYSELFKAYKFTLFPILAPFLRNIFTIFNP